LNLNVNGLLNALRAKLKHLKFKVLSQGSDLISIHQVQIDRSYAKYLLGSQLTKFIS
jgi:hypothetical protein